MIYADFVEKISLSGFQDPATDWMYAVLDLHDRILFFLLIIITLVTWFLLSGLRSDADHMAFFIHEHSLEFLWTLSPFLIIWSIGLSSVALMYQMDSILTAYLTVKILGNQWFWSYNMFDSGQGSGLTLSPTGFESTAFSSFIIDNNSLKLGQLANLLVDNQLILPVLTSIRLIVTSVDVIHSFAVPSLLIKVDAIVGRLNQTYFIANRTGYFTGQCSELCGALHGFMLITAPLI